MRTTINLEEDIAEQLRNISHEQRSSFTATLNNALREGLRRQGSAKVTPYVTKPWKTGFAAGVDPSKLNQLADELEDEEQIRRLGLEN